MRDTLSMYPELKGTADKLQGGPNTPVKTQIIAIILWQY